MPIRVTIGEQSWLTDDLTFAEVRQIEEETGETWAHANPLRSAKMAYAIMARFLARTMELDAARARLDAWSLRAVVDAITVVPQDDRPQEFVDGMPVVDPKAGGAEPATT